VNFTYETLGFLKEDVDILVARYMHATSGRIVVDVILEILS
jgi:hypothetical protein